MADLDNRAHFFGHLLFMFRGILFAIAPGFT